MRLKSSLPESQIPGTHLILLGIRGLVGSQENRMSFVKKALFCWCTSPAEWYRINVCLIRPEGLKKAKTKTRSRHDQLFIFHYNLTGLFIKAVFWDLSILFKNFRDFYLFFVEFRFYLWIVCSIICEFTFGIYLVYIYKSLFYNFSLF